ncbi:MAG: STAS/SEC14 domain-containing protein [Sulfuricurvum sp.]|uniref:STAS/SEC14 domain-containing protein n=1 Tax=Sulfuricurvum sp. TaxID=2025608 RepID=UPI0026205D75|nr:STAS/SEC14 domain-containing protein [Sulfuricurvum sp.]MDD3598258.1 STAS/SEC14 domain-containing protein [Sulfuricurvum sp.]MDD4884254.1 STAS/SEC14 domain-containing protein [Sulfuricurvum sp.]
MPSHAIDITIDQSENEFTVTMKIVGKLTHSDYELLNPMMDNALAGIDKPDVKVLVDLLEFTGYELHALWDDFKFGLKYNKVFTKIALVGNKRWEETAVTIGNWFTHAKMHYFESTEDAFSWLRE